MATGGSGSGGRRRSESSAWAHHWRAMERGHYFGGAKPLADRKPMFGHFSPLNLAALIGQESVLVYLKYLNESSAAESERSSSRARPLTALKPAIFTVDARTWSPAQVSILRLCAPAVNATYFPIFKSLVLEQVRPLHLLALKSAGFVGLGLDDT